MVVVAAVVWCGGGVVWCCGGGAEVYVEWRYDYSDIDDDDCDDDDVDDDATACFGWCQFKSGYRRRATSTIRCR